MYAKVTFTPGGKDNRFDFTFAASRRSRTRPRGPTLTTAAPATRRRRRAAAADAPPTACARRVARASIRRWCRCRFPTPCPRCSRSSGRAPIRFARSSTRASFAAIYVPAFQAKDLALALDEHKSELPPSAARSPSRRSRSWCARRTCSTRSATSATSSRFPRRTRSSSKRRTTSTPRFRNAAVRRDPQ